MTAFYIMMQQKRATLKKLLQNTDLIVAKLSFILGFIFIAFIVYDLKKY